MSVLDFNHIRYVWPQQMGKVVQNSRFRKMIPLLFWLLFLFPGLAAAEHLLTALEAQKIIEENRGSPKFVIVDLRTKKEFDAGHIEGATLVHYYATNFMRIMTQLDHEATLFLYCQKGRQSLLAFRALQRLRFATLYILDGGIEEWVNAGLPVEIS